MRLNGDPCVQVMPRATLCFADKAAAPAAARWPELGAEVGPGPSLDDPARFIVNLPPMLCFAVSCLLAGAAVGALELVAEHGLTVPFDALVVAAAMGAVPTVLFGALLAVVTALLGRVAFLRRTFERARARVRFALAARDNVIAVHAWYLTAALAAAATFLIAGPFYATLWRLQSTALALDLARAGAVALAMLFVIVAVLVRPAVSALARRADARFGLPRPKNRALRFLVFALLPAVALLVPVWRRYHEVVRGQWVAVGFALALLLACLFWLAASGLEVRLRRPVELGVCALWVVGLAWSNRTLGTNGAGELFERLRYARFGLTLAREAADFDLDGTSQWLGERDCAPFDARRSPLFADSPGNGIDEDCDGTDARRGPRVPTPRFADAALPLERRRYNIVWVIIDGLRPDRVGAYAGRRGLTPYLDAFAREAVVFDQAYSQSSSTLFSFSSMFAGVNPAALTWVTKLGRPQLDERHTTLAERLRPLRYQSAIFMTGWTQRTYVGFQQGYDQAFTTNEIDMRGQFWTQHTAPFVTTQAIEFVEAALAKHRSFFATVYYHDTHYPYVRHPGDTDRGEGMEERYDGEVAFVDRYVGFLLEYLRYRGSLYEDSIVLVTSDHGEEFREHGRLQHARTCYVESTHVPLMLYVPKLLPRRVASDVALIDIVPALLELVGATSDTDELQGQSLFVPVFAGQKVDAERPIFCSVASQWSGDERFFERSVRSGSFALTQDVKSGRLRLFDRRGDAREERDLAADPAQAGRVAELKALLSESRTGNLSDALSAR